MTLWGEIVLDGARRTVTIQRSFATTRDDLWNAITEEDRLARWFGRVTRDGDDYEIRMLDVDEVTVGTVLECEPENRLVVKWSYATEAESELEVVLSDIPGACLLTLTHRRLQAVGAAVYGSGWEDFLHVLGGHLGAPVDFDGFEIATAEYRRREAALVPALIVHDDSRSGVHLERLLNASVEWVWSALTRPETIGRWLWPVVSWPDDPARDRALAIDDHFALGDANAPGGIQNFRVVGMEQMKSISLLWGETALRIEVLATVEGTRLTLEQAPVDDVFAGGRKRGGPDWAAGWHSLVDQLSLVLDGLPLPGNIPLWEAAYAVYSRQG